MVHALGIQHCFSVATVIRAQQLLQATPIHIAIIDHRLLGKQTGSDFALWLCADTARAQIIRVSYSTSDQGEILGVNTPLHLPLFHAIIAKSPTHTNLRVALEQWMPHSPP